MPSTVKLYYENPYLSEFEAAIVSIEKAVIKQDGEEKPYHEITLDRTCFYPEGGGQIPDTGEISGLSVNYVHEKNEGGNAIIVHRAKFSGNAALKPGDTVKCKIDMERRFQNMQDHTGQHILSEAFIITAGLHTISMHMGGEFMTIDLGMDMKALPKNFKIEKSVLDSAEDLANSIIFKNKNISTFFVSKNELKNYKLRKMPELEDEKVRIVATDDFDTSLCCGTHVAKTGEVGIIKITGQEKANNGMRIKFVCGGRALADYRLKNAIICEAAETMSVKPSDLKKSIEKLMDDNRAVSKSKSEYFEKYYQKVAEDLAAGKNLQNNIYYEVFEQLPYSELSRVAQIFSKSTGSFAFILVKPELSGGEKAFRFILGKTEKYVKDLKPVFAELTASFGIKGGGSALVMQGGCIGMARLDEFKSFVFERI